MRFLVTLNQKYMVPPEVQIGLMDGSIAWAKKYTASKKLEQSWGCAGMPAGGGVLNVNSIEELNQIIAELPLGAVSETEIRPIMGMEEAINQAKKALMAIVKK
jgi:muconolactone delta-isomerase